jgi:hypothetical protein
MPPSAFRPFLFRFDPGKVLRGLRSRARHAAYSPTEVRLRLRLDPADGNPRTQAVHAAAANIGAWTVLMPPDADRETRLSLAAARLPSVVFWYRQGLSPEEIGRRLTPFGDSTYGERAINAACALIARLLNQH